MKYCISCGTQIPDESLFCLSCGAKQEATEVKEAADTTPIAEVEETVETAEAPVKEAPKAKFPIFSVVRNSFILLVALVLLIGAFMPISRIPMEGFVEDVEDLDVGVTTVQQIVLIFDSFKNLDYFDLMETDLYEDYLDFVEEFEEYDEDDLKDLSSSERRKIDDGYFLVLRLAMQSEDVTPQSSLVLSAIFGVLYIVFAIVFFVFALINLFATLGLVVKYNKQSLHKKTLGMLTAAPAALLATYCANYMFTTGKLSKISVWIIVLSVIAIAITTALRWLFTKREATNVIVTRGIAIGLAVIVFCLVFAPVITTSFKTPLKTGKTTAIEIAHNASFFTEFDYSGSYEETVEDLSDSSKSHKIQYFENMFEKFEYMSKTEATEGAGKSLNASALVLLFSSKIDSSLGTVLSFTYILFIVVALAALVILWQNLYFFATGKYNRSTVIFAKVISVSLAILALIVTVVFVLIMQELVDDYLMKSYSLNLSAGIVFMAIFAIGSLFCPSNLLPKPKKEKPMVEKPKAVLEEQF